MSGRHQPGDEGGSLGNVPAGSGAYRHQAACSIAAMLLLPAVIIALHLYGKASRVYGAGAETFSVDGPEQAYAVLEGKKVKGRILVLFGNYPHFKTSNDYAQVRQLTASNFIEFSAFNNIIRKIYYIIPEDAWEATMQKGAIGAIRQAPGRERGMYLYNLVGIPIIATTPTSLPHLSEPAVVLINSRRFDEASVRSILSEKEIVSDLILSYNDK